MIRRRKIIGSFIWSRSWACPTDPLTTTTKKCWWSAIVSPTWTNTVAIIITWTIHRTTWSPCCSIKLRLILTQRNATSCTAPIACTWTRPCPYRLARSRARHRHNACLRLHRHKPPQLQLGNTLGPFFFHVKFRTLVITSEIRCTGSSV